MTGSMASGGSATFSITPGQLKAGQTLVLETSVGQSASSMTVAVAQGPVGACRLVDASLPVPPPGAVTSTGSGGTVTHTSDDGLPSTQGH